MKMNRRVTGKGNKQQHKVRKLGVNLKILLPGCLLVFLVCVNLGINAYNRVVTGLTVMGKEQAEQAASMATTILDGDIIPQIGPGSESELYYREQLNKIRNLQDANGIVFVYTLYTDGTNVYYGLDSDGSAGHAYPGDLYEDATYEELRTVFEGDSYVEEEYEETESGPIFTAYAPIYDSKLHVVGILGCDVSAAYVVDRIGAAFRSTLQISAIMIAVAIALLSLLVTRVTRNLGKVNDKIYDLVHNEGDLTQKLTIKSGDELELIANNVNALLEYIRGIMLNIADNSNQLNESTETVADNLMSARDSISDVSATMEEMSAAMEETSASLTQVNESVVSIDATVVAIAGKAEEESIASKDTAQKAQAIYETAETERAAAADQAQEMSVLVNEKIERSKAVQQINALTEEIINITDQTSLLALNANIEAARAGEAGRGFAVVAGEIGSLAANSAKAAEQIQKVSREVIGAVNELAEEAERMIHFMNETAMGGYDKLLQNSKDYQSDVNHLSSILMSFAEESKELRGNIDSIKEAVDAVNIAVEESAKGVVSVTEVATDLTASMEDINEVADSNKKISSRLGDEVGRFKL